MRPTTCITLAICLSAALPLLGCGGAGGIIEDFAGPETERISLSSEPTLDGRVAVGGHVDFTAPVFEAYTGDRGGDIAPTYRSRQLYAFYLGDLPADATIVRATLRVHQAHVEGIPYGHLGDVLVDHVDYVEDPGPQSYDDQTLARAIGAISTSPDLGIKTLDVTAQVAGNQAAGDSWSQFRLRFWRDGISIADDENDYANFTDGENDDFPGAEPPRLDVVYER